MIKGLFFTFVLVLLGVPMALAQPGGEGKSEGSKAEVVDTSEIIWHRYDEGLKAAREEDKHIFINFTSNWCGYCKKMDRTTFKETEIIKMLNEDFVSVKVNGDSKKELNVDGYKITERDLARSEYGVRGYPSFWFLKPNGEKLGVLPGYQKADVLLEVLFFMKTGLYNKMTFNEFLEGGGRKAHKG